MAININKVDDFIFEYAKYIHLDSMPDAVRARFNDYIKNKDFAGNMKEWPKILENIAAGDWPELNDNKKLEDLYALFQNVFENMSQDVGTRDFKGKQKDFFEQWYGKGKLFQKSTIDTGVMTRLKDFAKLLEKHQTFFADKFKDYLPADKKFDDFIGDIQDPDKLKNVIGPLKQIMGLVQLYSDPQYKDYRMWPEGEPQYDFNKTTVNKTTASSAPAIDIENTDSWFKHTYNPAFKHRFPELFQTLVNDPKIFEYFQSKDSKGTISKNIRDAIEKTNYADEKSKDFVPEKDSDEKNIFQKLSDKIDNIKENQVDPWANILRGTRRFFSPAAKTIIEACSKVKNKDGKPLKPTDGLKGILDNKDAIAAKVDASPNGREHWKWISGKLQKYSQTLPKAFEGALRNPKQMKKIVSKFIIDAIKEGKTAEAKTALELISTIKYGIMHSRTVDALGKSDLTVLSDKDLSWNKYEGMRFVTTAIDKTAKFAMLGAGRLIAAAHNKWTRDTTKFKGKDGFLKSAHELWQDKNDKNKYKSGVLDKIENDLATAKVKRKTAIDALKTHGGGDAKKGLDTLNKEISDNSILNDKDKPTLEALRNDLTDKNSRLGSNPNAYRIGLANDIKTWEADKKSLEIEKKAKEKEFADNEANIKSLEAMLKGKKPADPDWVNLIQTKALLEQQGVKLQNEINQLDSDIADKDNQITNGNATLKELHPDEIDKLDKKIKALEKDISDRQSVIDSDQLIIDAFNDTNKEVNGLLSQKQDAQKIDNGWDNAHKDEYMELMAYWDMLETFSKSHQFTFAADKMRKKFLNGYNKGNSKAQQLTADFLNKYKQKYSMNP